MDTFVIHILGCGSASPTMRHWPTSQVINLRGKLYMIDCGEGCQYNMRKHKLGFSRLRTIFISHLHGDHCFGLMGLLSTLGLLGRDGAIEVYGPKGIETYVDFFQHSFAEHTPFDIKVHIVDTTQHQLVYSDPSVNVYSLPLQHRIATTGYLFEERCQTLHLRKPACDLYEVPIAKYQDILAGHDYMLPSGTIIPNDQLTIPGRKPRRYAFCSDTRFVPELAELVRGVDLLYHEATFEATAEKRAAETFHSTASQAATIAQMAQVKRLLIGHYSARYESSLPLLREAQAIFPETIAADEGLTVSI